MNIGRYFLVWWVLSVATLGCSYERNYRVRAMDVPQEPDSSPTEDRPDVETADVTAVTDAADDRGDVPTEMEDMGPLSDVADDRGDVQAMDAPTDVDIVEDRPDADLSDVPCPLAGQMRCGATCVAADDPMHCGACGRACAASLVCVLGACVVPTEALSASYQHTCLRNPDGTVQCWGADMNGRLGACGTAASSPMRVATLNNVVGISAGPYHTCALRATGRVFCWGLNEYGRLGDNTTITRTCPVEVMDLTDAIQVVAGNYFTCALRRAGTVVCWGYGPNCELGAGPDGGVGAMGSLFPRPVPGLTDVVALASGYYHTCALRASGEVLCWGQNTRGALGDGTNLSQCAPVRAMEPGSAAQIATGYFHSCALRRGSGEVVCWGGNDQGQLGDNMTTDRRTATTNVRALSDAVRIAAGSSHTCALREGLAGGPVVCWGANDYGELGDGTGPDAGVGMNRQPLPVAVQMLSDAEGITAGYNHTCARSRSRGVVCWGANGLGQLSDRTRISRTTPVNVQGL